MAILGWSSGELMRIYARVGDQATRKAMEAAWE